MLFIVIFYDVTFFIINIGITNNVTKIYNILMQFEKKMFMNALHYFVLNACCHSRIQIIISQSGKLNII